jgi:phage tail-like protein
MTVGERTDPYRSFNFEVVIDGEPGGSFSEASGLVADGDTTDYREGTDPENSVRKLTGLRKYPNITLRRGYTRNDVLWRWYRNILNGERDRRSGSIVLRNEAGEPVIRWNFENAFINKIEGPALRANANEVAMEAAELVHEKLTIELA